MFNPAQFSIKYNRTSLVLYTVLMLLGVMTFLTIGRREYPAFTIRDAKVVTRYPGRTAVQVEEEVTEVLEQKVREMPEVDEVKSTSKAGLSIMTVSISEDFGEADMEDIWTDMRNKLDEAQLPDGANTPMVNDDFGDEFPYVYALKGDGYTFAEMQDYAEDIRDEVLALDGVGKVELHGDVDERIYLEFSSKELEARGVSPSQIAGQLRSQNAAVDSGSADYADERLQILTLGEFKSVEELGEFRLSMPGDATSVRVSDVFHLRREYEDPPTALSHFNGERVLCLAISMVEGGVVTEIGERIQTRLDEIEQTLPVGLEIEQMFFQPEYVDASIAAFLVNLGQAFFFVVLVMLLFAGWRLAVIVGVLVPSVCLFCFAFMPMLGVELEMMSIAALIIALGILVDNAVVVCEQILNRLNEGQERMRAVSESIQGLIVPLLAASGTTIAAFGVIAMAPGGAAEFTFSLFAVVTLSLLGSWLLSLTIIPMLCFYFLKPLKRDTFVGRVLTKFYQPYESLLRLTIRLRWAYPLLILVLTILALGAFKFVPSIFFPPNERGQFTIDFELPLGKNIEATEAGVSSLEEWLLTEHADEVRSVSSWIGEGGPRWYLSLVPQTSSPNYALLSVLTYDDDPAKIKALTDEINLYAQQTFPDARVTSKVLENGPPVGDPIQIELSGQDMDTIYKLRDRIVAEVKQVDGLYDVRDDWGAWTKQVTVEPDPVRASHLGVTTDTIAEALEQQFSGLYATSYREGEDSIPVVLRARDEYRNHLERLPDLPVYGSKTGVVPLGLIADVHVDFLPGSIKRVDTLRTMTIQGRVRGRYASAALADIQPRLAALTASEDWPQGYKIDYGGEIADSAEAQQNIVSGMPLPMACLAFILIAQFNSLRRFAIILITIPPMMVGVVPGLLVTGSSFGFMTLLGMIALLGIIVNNAILLIDETNLQLKVEGQGLLDAVVAAAKSRLRPILMTTLTTIIGLLPLALSGGGMWSSMAYAMMFGLGFATLLTLFLCPVLFYLFYRRTYA